MERRKFLEFIGKGTLLMPVIPSLLTACTSRSGGVDSSAFPSSKDELILSDGLSYKVLIQEGDMLNDKMVFGTENDYLAFIPTGSDEGILWVNHEFVNPMFASGWEPDKARHRDMITTEMHMVGGSIVKIKKEWGGDWKFVKNDPINNRLTAASMIPFEWPELVAGNRSVRGTLANCSGGVTPWGTILTCEENYDNFYGEYDYVTDSRTRSKLGWERFFPDHLPQHYGWVVEVDIRTGSAKKHPGLGRMAHECATVKALADGRVVIYTGDDQDNGCVFKYVSLEAGKIYPGNLYVANMDAGKWELLDIARPELAGKFADQTELLIRTREAALLVGGTQLDRPEDIEIDPLTGDVLVSLTNNKPKGVYHGSILKIREEGDYDAMTFVHDTFLTGGEESGFSCPDNMAFDAAGNLWFCSDISDDALNKPPYDKFGNNGLFVLIRNGVDAGKIFQVASAPNDAEFTGPCFAPDGETLFLCVQHPGEGSKNLSDLTSNWPGGGTTIPRSAVVAIQGDLLRTLQQVV